MASLEQWKTDLEGYVPCKLPASSEAELADSGPSPPSVTATLSEPHDRLASFSNERAVDVSTILCVAWAVALRAFTGQDSVSFAVATKTPGLRPCRMMFASESSVSALLLACQVASDDKASLVEIPLSDLPQEDGLGLTADFFNTCILCPVGRHPMSCEAGAQDFHVAVGCEVENDVTRIVLTYRTTVLQKAHATALVNTVERAVSEMMAGKDRVDDFCLLSDEDRAQMSRRNERPSDVSGARIEALIAERCRQAPSAAAVCAWDGNLSYGELDELSGVLARYMRGLGIGPDMFVPVLFEKSRWAVVAMLGVVKAGAAFVLLDPTHPRKRLGTICDKVSARIILSSSQQAGLAAGLVGHVVRVGDEAMKCMTADVNGHADELRNGGVCEAESAPCDALYVVFTSGSTGTPKGAVNCRSSFLAAMPVYLESLELGDRSRVFQFASCAFDVSIFDTLMTLMAGGCVCVPSNTDRSSDLANAILHFGATHLSMTPTVARILNPREVSTVRTIVLGGERPAPEDMNRWVDNHVRVVQLHGASECAVMSVRCTSRDMRASSSSSSSSSCNIRSTVYDTGSRCWVVNPRNHQQLQPLGAIGELLVEGPVVGRGYLDDAVQTSETFIEAPTWLRDLRQGGSDRVYKTGDLVWLAADGSIEFVCRKNTQVKLRGQRIELGEVEHHLKIAWPSAEDCIAELVAASDASRPPMLMAFICEATEDTTNRTNGLMAGRNATSDTVLAEPSPGFRSQIPSVLSKLQQALPSYMVPSAILPLNTVPLTGMDKINRRLLRQVAERLSRQELQRYQPERGAYRSPGNDTERSLQTLFARVLGLAANEVGADDNFFVLGGDSLTAMKMVAMARGQETFKWTVQNVFDHPRLSELARLASVTTPAEDEKRNHVPPFSLVAGPKQGVLRDAARQCRLPARAIEDVYPCTPLQRGLLAETMREATAFVAVIELFLPAGVRLDRLRQAWTAVARANPILRTRMILSSDYGLLQAVTREDVAWITRHDGEHDGRVEGVVGRPLAQLVLHPGHAREGAESEARPARLFLHVHHAVYDGYSLQLMLAQVNRAYRGDTLDTRPVSPFIRYLATMPDTATDYWQSLCRGLETPSFPALPHGSYRPYPDAKTTHVIAMSSPRAREYTLNTHVRLAWAMTQAHQQNCPDICFGTVVSGRNAPVDGIESIMIPTVATIPCRVSLDADSTVRETLGRIQDVATRGIPYEQLGLVEIARLGHDAAHACSFQTLLVVQPAVAKPETHDLFGVSDPEAGYRADATYAIHLFCGPGKDVLSVTVLHDEHVVPKLTMRNMLRSFGQALQTIHEDPAGSVGQVVESLGRSGKGLG
uniref:Lysergyl peptide synthetase 2 n=1 Tax=Claviceps africana TaxID=83212 RepID=A0A1X9JZ10_9HYPO|nr:lysergyl peptide synthetase 2 [Claviceps africana]